MRITSGRARKSRRYSTSPLGRGGRGTLEEWFRWLVLNVALFMAVAVLFSYGAYLLAGLLGAEYDALEIAFAPFTFGLFLGPLYAIGFIFYLPMVTLIPRRWPKRHRRLTALLLSPVVGAALWFVTPLYPLATAPYAVLLPLLYGAVVRLVPRSAGSN